MIGNTYTDFGAFLDSLYQEFVEVDHVNKLRDALDNLTLVKC